MFSKITHQAFRVFIAFTFFIALASACAREQPEGNTTSQTAPFSPQADSPTLTRVVQHTMGETVIPANPKRIVVLDFIVLNSLLALNVQPVGAAGTQSEISPFTAFHEGKLDGVTYVGYVYQPNLEKIIQLQPDLIIGSQFHKEIYGNLSQIAPTILSDVDSSDDWKIALKWLAEAIDKAPEAEQLLDGYYQRIEQFQQRMGEDLRTTQVSLINFRSKQVRVYLKDSFPGSVIEDVGLTRPPAEDKEGFIEEVSIEQIPQFKGDVIFSIVDQPSVASLERFSNSPLWSQLKAVQEGRVYSVKSDIWIFGSGVTGANLILDDLSKYLQ